MSEVRSRDLVVVGASAGGVETLRALVAGLPADFPACVVVVLHMPATSPSALPAILSRAGPLPVRQAREGDPLAPGTVLVAAPDHHVIVYDGAVTLARGPHENGHRPAIDVLFRSAARARGAGVVGVVLSGALDDGAAGLVAIARRGGACLVQDFDEALYDSMPRAAAAAVPEATVLPVADMPGALASLVGQLVGQGAPDGELASRNEGEKAVVESDADESSEPGGAARPAGYGCPDCGGALFEVDEGPLVRYRCLVGHAWSPESLAARQTVDLESALWMALRSLEEKAALNRQLSVRTLDRGHDEASRKLSEEADEAVHAAGLLRGLINRMGDVDSPDTAE